jgi:organic radical activating enzyme
MIDTCRAENQSLMEQLNAHREGVTTMILKADFYKNQKKSNEEIDFEQFAKLIEDKGMLTARAEELKQLLAKKDSDMKLAEENLGILMKKNEAMCQEFQKQLLNAEDSKEKLVESHEEEKQNLIVCVINLTTQLEALKAMEEKLQNDLTTNEK